MHAIDRLKQKINPSSEGESSKTMHATAKVNGVVVADADHYEIVENNVYFPPESVKMEFFTPTETHTHCPWKGDASYYSIKVDGAEVKDAAWYYPAPFEKATNIKDYVAFYKGKVDVTKE